MYDNKNLVVLSQSEPLGLERTNTMIRAQRTRNWIRYASQLNKLSPNIITTAYTLPCRRMIPHIFGWFPMTAVWFILIVQLENAKSDIDEISDRNIPGWVESLIYGQFLIFTQFAFVQIVFQRLNPGFYFGKPLSPNVPTYFPPALVLF